MRSSFHLNFYSLNFLVEIFLPSSLSNSCYSLTVSVPTISSLDKLATVSNIQKNTLSVSSFEMFYELSYSIVLNIYNFNNLVNIYYTNRYKILIWDPGISYYLVIPIFT